VVTDVRADGIGDGDLAAIMTAFGDKAVNRASTTWRGLSEAERALPVDALLRMQPSVMKRPVIEKDGAWFIGWDKNVQAAVLG